MGESRAQFISPGFHSASADVMLRSERGVFLAGRTIFLFFSLAAGPPWLFCNAGIIVWIEKKNNPRLRIFSFF